MSVEWTAMNLGLSISLRRYRIPKAAYQTFILIFMIFRIPMTIQLLSLSKLLILTNRIFLDKLLFKIARGIKLFRFTFCG
jgi:hypothetical protein